MSHEHLGYCGEVFWQHTRCSIFITISL